MLLSYRFNEFLASKLSALSVDNVLDTDKTLTILSNSAKNYGSMDVNTRIALLDKVNNWYALLLCMNHQQERFLDTTKIIIRFGINSAS